MLEAIADTQPDAECLVFRDRRVTWHEMQDRTRRLANHLLGQGLGSHTRALGPGWSRERPGSPRRLPPQRQRVPRVDARRLEGPGRAAQRQLPLRRRRADAICSATPERRRSWCTDAFAPTLRRRAPSLPELRVILQVADDSGHRVAARRGLVRGGVGGGVARTAIGHSGVPTTSTSSYTGGTTGMPKGVLWRNGDAMIECFGGRRPRSRRGCPWPTPTRVPSDLQPRPSCTGPATG